MTRRCILIFGVSGVGKSVASARFAAADPNFVHLRASELLSEALGTFPELLRTASENKILRNQLLLADVLERRMTDIVDPIILLDGHAVIDNDRNLIRIPLEAVAALRPDGMLLLEASPETVLLRRRASERALPDRSLPELAAELSKEREAVLEYQQALGVPLESVWAEPAARLDHAMAALLQRIQHDRN